MAQSAAASVAEAEKEEEDANADVAVDAADEVCTQSSEAEAEAEAAANEDPSPTVDAPEPEEESNVDANEVKDIKYKFASTSSADKGIMYVRPAEDFAVDSFYRKRDRGTSARGVTLLVGRRESDGREAVVSVLFDRTRFDEAAASEWYESNRSRFE